MEDKQFGRVNAFQYTSNGNEGVGVSLFLEGADHGSSKADTIEDEMWKRDEERDVFEGDWVSYERAKLLHKDLSKALKYIEKNYSGK